MPTRYSPVRHFPPPEGGFTFDLHVLSPPPAFVLSQDQTLRSRRVACSEEHGFTLMSLGDPQSDRFAKGAEAPIEPADEGSLYFQSLKEPGLGAGHRRDAE